MLFIALLGLIAVANGVPIENQYPNCDLLGVSYMTLHETRRGEYYMSLAWDRNNNNYAKLNGPVQSYVVRHGPLENGQLSKDSRLLIVSPRKTDKMEIHHILPGHDYGVQICGLSNKNGTIDDNAWENAWVWKYNLSEPNSVIGHSIKLDHNNFLPKCNLIYISYLDTTNNYTSRTMSMHYSWDKKISSYDQLKSIDHYRVRHGRQDAWGMPIKEEDAHYFDTKSNATSFEVTGIPFGSYYGLQVCAMANHKNDHIDWQSDAIVMSADFTHSANWIERPEIIEPFKA